MGRRILAWGVHLYTATGLLLAAAMTVLIIRGGDHNNRLALLLMVVATVIDSTDGMLARLADVRTWASGVNGRTLDDITDFHTYTSIPLLFIWQSGLLTWPWALTLLSALIASAYGFSQSQAKTKDGFFLGFPSYWNALAFYFYFTHPPELDVALIVLLFALLTFVPARYLYPNAGGPLSRITIILATLWGVVLILIVTGSVRNEELWVWMSLAFPVYYLVVSWWITLRS